MSGFKVLVVEDDVLVARDIEASLRHLGYEIAGVVCEDSKVLQAVAESLPDLVLMDIDLSGEQDGIALAQQVRDRFQIPTVFLTAYTNGAILERVKATNPFGYVLKPYEVRNLQIVLELAMARRQMELSQQDARLESAHPSNQDLNPKLLTQMFHGLLMPLTTIQFAADSLGDRSRNADETTQQMYLQQIQSATDAIYQLLTSWLSLEQLQTATTLTQFARHDMNALFKRWVDIMQQSIGDRNPIQFFHPPYTVVAKVDAALIGQLVSQLLSNAIRYSPPASPIVLTLLSDRQYCYFRVRDRGIGVPPEDLPYLLKPFYRGSNVGDLPGAGLGLAIAQCIIDLHHGKIWAKSQPGQGTSFICKFPLQLTQQTPDAETNPKL